MESRELSGPRRRSLPFVVGGEECRVDLRGPQPVRRGSRWVVQLVDLWVATMLPWDVIDLTFDVVARAPDGPSIVYGPIDGLHFAQGFVAVATKELRWDQAREGTPHGLRAVAVVAHVRAQSAPEAPPAPVPRPLAPSPSIVRLLPHAGSAYPVVKWRLARLG